MSLLDDDQIEFDGTDEFRCKRCGEHPDFCQWWDYERELRPSGCAYLDDPTDSREAS